MSSGPNRLPPDSGIDTGPGGFTVDGKLYTAVTVEPGGDYEAPRDTYRNDVAVDKTVKDLAPSVKVVLGQFLSDITKGIKGPARHPNSFPIDPPDGAPPVTLTDEGGYPAHLGGSRNESQYGDTLGVEAPPIPGSPRDATLYHEGFAPGATPDGKLNGNNIFTEKGAPARARYVSAILSQNRFTADAPRAEDPDVPSSAESVRYYDRGATVQLPPSGKSDDGKSTNLERGRDIAYSRLATVGATLSMRSSMELGSLGAEYNPNGGSAVAGALLPSFNQLMIERVSTSNLRAADVLRTLTNAGVDENEEFNVTDLSWGSLNNVNDPFDGLAAIGMVTTAVALSIAMVAVVEAITGLISLLGGGAAPTLHHRTPYGRGVLGAYVFKEAKPPSILPLPVDIAGMLGIKQTRGSLNDAVSEGVKLFFLGPNKSLDISDFFNSPGYVAVHARNILRSALTFIDAIKGVTKGSPIDIVKNLLGLVDTLRRSKIIAAINVFAIMGESAGDEVLAKDGSGRAATRLDIQGQDAASMDRLGDGIRLAYGTSTAPESTLLPPFIYTISGYGEPRAAFTNNNANFGKVQLSTTRGRIDPYDVQQLELQYDAEYLPFYFQDLRTNEITGFHAFLESLGDSFSPSYESIDGVGRVDPVKIYKSTDRKIDFSFHIVSTNPEDNDEMWRKINKLVTLVYPQYSAGKTLNSEDGKYVFKQPFSQLMTSTPLIRLRIGDVVRSNFTRFDLARLFGYGDDSFGMSLDSKAMTTPGADVSGANQAYQDKLYKMLSDLRNESLGAASGYAFKIAPGTYSAPTSDGTDLYVDNNSEIYEFLPIKVVGSYVVMQCKRITDPEFAKPSTGIVSDIIDRLGVRSIVTNNATSVEDSYYSIPSSAIIGLSPTTLGAKKLRSEIPAALTPAGTLSDFMSSENNAIVGAFRQMGGKGLAGVIESLAFDWGESKNRWRLDVGKKAPMSCKVTVSFSAIHDISPGIDHMGINRGAIYPVGPYVHSLDKEFG